MNLKRILLLGLALLMTLSHLACGGGGGGGGGGNNPPVTRTGVFKDSNVAGIRYETSSGHFGVTDANGQYVYDDGDTVTFYVGGVSLGQTTARGVVTPIDLVVGGSSSNPIVLNIARFLMMLDIDGDPDNGITISAAVQAVADAWAQVNFNAPDLFAELSTIMDECQVADGGAHLLRDAAFAQAHIEDSLRCAYSGAFKGTFRGSDSGRFGAVIDAQTGEVEGAAYSNYYRAMVEGEGTQNISYDQSLAFITGFVDTGADFNGQLTSPDAMSGTWSDPDDSGTFSGRRIGGAYGATHRYSGIASDIYGTAAILSMDVNDAGVMTGVGYDIQNNRDFTFSGTVTGTDIDAVTTDGVVITGTLSPDHTFTGTWEDTDGDDGTFSGSGCRLN